MRKQFTDVSLPPLLNVEPQSALEQYLFVATIKFNYFFNFYMKGFKIVFDGVFIVRFNYLKPSIFDEIIFLSYETDEN